VKVQSVKIDSVGPSLNAWYSGIHWTKRSKVKDEWRAHIAGVVDTLEPVVNYPVIIEVEVHKKRVFDSSNVAATGKLAEDGLVKSGILLDDTPKYVRSVFYTCVKDDKEYTIIRIIETENGEDLPTLY
jgi:hypothetical protein